MTFRRKKVALQKALGVFSFLHIFWIVACYDDGYQSEIQDSVYVPPPPPPPNYYSQPQPQYPQQQQYAPPPPPPYNRDTEVYEAITYLELNTSYHCGVIPDTNFELYRKSTDSYEVADVTPFGKFPWIAVILYKNNVICQGTLVHANLILTSAKCIPEYRSLAEYEIRLGDWDILTDYNEYEAYVDRELRLCSRHSISKHTPPQRYGYGYQGGSYDDSSDLIAIKANFNPSFDKLPHVKPLCLPKTYSYEASYYNKGDYSHHNSYATCWLAGWYGSKITSLKNHPSPHKAESYSYGHASSERASSYNQHYYKSYDESMIQKRAKVKRVPCPKGYSGYGSSSSVCFIGVDGYDACVAEKGSGIFCTIREYGRDNNYDSGYNNHNKDYQSGQHNSYSSSNDYHHDSYDNNVQSHLHPDYVESSNSYHHQSNQNYEKSIRAHPSPDKSVRFRAVLFAVVQKAAKCREGYDSYGKTIYRKSRPVIATKVDYDVVDGVMDVLWTHGYDESCPVPSPQYNKSYKSNYYFNYPKSSYNQYGYKSSNYHY